MLQEMICYYQNINIHYNSNADFYKQYYWKHTELTQSISRKAISP